MSEFDRKPVFEEMRDRAVRGTIARIAFEPSFSPLDVALEALMGTTTKNVRSDMIAEPDEIDRIVSKIKLWRDWVLFDESSKNYRYQFPIFANAGYRMSTLQIGGWALFTTEQRKPEIRGGLHISRILSPEPLNNAEYPFVQIIVADFTHPLGDEFKLLIEFDKAPLMEALRFFKGGGVSIPSADKYALQYRASLPITSMTQEECWVVGWILDRLDDNANGEDTLLV